MGVFCGKINMKKSYHNLEAFLSAFESPCVLDLYKKINNISQMHSYELENFKEVAEEIIKHSTSPHQLFGYFLDKIVNVTIREQFDILRFSKDSILNIELKNEEIASSSILDQLVRHHYLLNCIPGNRKVSLFTYVSSTKNLYKFVEGELKLSTFENLVSLISIDYIEQDLLEDLRPDDYIISPYNNINKFKNFKYFLNTEQNRFVSEQLLDIESSYHSMIKGGAGTGKSLVLFDLATKLTKLDKKILFIFCSSLDTYTEIDSMVEFKFVDIRNSGIFHIKPYEYDYIIIDESQRLRKEQFVALFKKKSKLIFAVDKAQTLKPEEDILDVEGQLNRLFKDNKKYDLTERVRTDVSLSTFIQKFFDKSKSGLQPIEFPKVNAVYFSDKLEATKFLKQLVQLEEYVSIEVPQYRTRTSNVLKNPKIFSDSLDGFNVIGREFDNVVIPIDDRAYYYDGKLYFNPIGYFPYKALNGLFQAITRVKKNLLFVIVDNINLYEEIQKLINWEKDRNSVQTSLRLRRMREINKKSIEELCKVCKCNIETYNIIESTGVFPNNKMLKRLSNFYNINSDFLLGEPTQLSYSDFDIIYQLKTKSLNKEEKSKINAQLIKFLKTIK